MTPEHFGEKPCNLLLSSKKKNLRSLTVWTLGSCAVLQRSHFLQFSSVTHKVFDRLHQNMVRNKTFSEISYFKEHLCLFWEPQMRSMVHITRQKAFEAKWNQKKRTNLLAYAQILSMSVEFLRTDSTFPRDTYSPACSFTKSFFRSTHGHKNTLLSKGKWREAQQLQPHWLCTSVPWNELVDTCSSEGLIHTNDLQTAVRVDLSHVSSAEPSLPRFINNVVPIGAFIVVVAHGYIGPTNQDFSPWVWFVMSSIATWKNWLVKWGE